MKDDTPLFDPSRAWQRAKALGLSMFEMMPGDTSIRFVGGKMHVECTLENTWECDALIAVLIHLRGTITGHRESIAADFDMQTPTEAQTLSERMAAMFGTPVGMTPAEIRAAGFEPHVPVRVQLSRAKGWRMPPNTVSVARPCEHGNPFRVGDFGIPDAAAAVQRFREWRDGRIVGPVIPPVDDLRGKNLACWCKLDQPCHADVLLELANRPEGASA